MLMLRGQVGRTLVVSFSLLAGFLTACSPSQSYRQGQGFYSEDYPHAEVQAATKAGKATRIKTFSFEASSCGNYSTGLADEHLVYDTLRQELPKMGANAAERVTATEPMGNMLFSFVLTPMGCSDWTISGDALLVDWPVSAKPPPPR